MPPLRFFHRLIGAAEEPAPVYYIRGTSTNVGGTETFYIQFIDDGAQSPLSQGTITVNVDANGNFEYTYQNKQIYSLSRFARQNNTLLAIEFTDNMARCVEATFVFEHCENILSIDFHNATFENLTNGEQMFNFCQSMTSLDLSNATFAALTTAYGMFANFRAKTSLDLSAATFAALTDARSMFEGQSAGWCALQTIDLSSASFANLTNAVRMFYNCSNLTDITWSANLNLENLQYVSTANGYYGMFTNCTKLTSISAFGNFKFNNLLHCGGWFWNCTSLTSVDLHSAEFNNVQTCWAMFQTCLKLTTIDLPMATFANLVNSESLAYKNSNAASLLTTINMPSATLAKATNTKQIFEGWENLTTINVPSGSTAILPTSTAANAPMNLRYSPLSYQSMLNVANWLSDLSGQSAHTCTFKTSAWNALTAAEQANIDTILSGKNWTRAIA